MTNSKVRGKELPLNDPNNFQRPLNFKLQSSFKIVITFPLQWPKLQNYSFEKVHLNVWRLMSDIRTTFQLKALWNSEQI